MKSIRINKKFNNYYKDANEACFVAYILLNKLIPFLKEHGKEIVSNSYKHCHIVRGKEETLAKEINKRVNNFDLDPDEEIWEVAIGNNNGLRVCVGVANYNDSLYFYPLFIDPHHMIYDDDRHGFNGKNYDFSFDDVK